MEHEIDDLVRRLVLLENELEKKLETKRTMLKYQLEERRAVFEEEVIQQHKLIKISLLAFLRRSPLATLIVTPAVYGLVVPIAMLDLGVSVFQIICFSAWDMERVRRSKYVIVDRHRLAYLNGIEKLNCAYCGYGNGVIAYAREVASRTEQYWCPIKHALQVRTPHPRYRGFVDYGDIESFRSRLDELRKGVKTAQKAGSEEPK